MRFLGYNRIVMIEYGPLLSGAKRREKMKKLLILAGLCTLGATAFGQELAVNGGFETGDMTGWTVVRLGAFSGVNSGGGTPHTGNDYFGMGAVDPTMPSDFYQDIATIV